jgi:hypothetical protein
VIAPFSSVEDLHSQVELYSIVNAACLLNNSSGYVQGIKKRRDSQHVKVQRHNLSGVGRTGIAVCAPNPTNLHVRFIPDDLGPCLTFHRPVSLPGASMAASGIAGSISGGAV